MSKTPGITAKFATSAANEIYSGFDVVLQNADQVREAEGAIIDLVGNYIGKRFSGVSFDMPPVAIVNGNTIRVAFEEDIRADGKYSEFITDALKDLNEKRIAITEITVYDNNQLRREERESIFADLTTPVSII